MEILGTPKLCWADQVKSDFSGHLEVKKVKNGNNLKSVFFGDFWPMSLTLTIFKNLM